MTDMEAWAQWSLSKIDVSPIIRATVLHAWLSHIHPYIDGNGRSARAISNLELIRARLPPVIIRKKEVTRYLDALAKSDLAGDLGPFFSLMIERETDALRGLELAARSEQGFDPFKEKLRKRQEQQLRIWHSSVKLLLDILELKLEQALEGFAGKVITRAYDSLEFDGYIDLCSGSQISKSWCFMIEVKIPALPTLKHLTWAGCRSPEMLRTSESVSGPSLYWSLPNPEGYPPWHINENQNPGIGEMSLCSDQDTWYAKAGNDIAKYSTHQLAEAIVNGYRNLLTDTDENASA